MSKFALKKIEQVDAERPFYKLVENGYCRFDEFCEVIEKDGNLSGYLDSIWRVMEWIANGDNVGTMIRPVKGGQKNEYEIKKGPLRVYFLKDAQNIVVTGGKKTNQKKDISKFQAVNRRYSDFKSNEDEK